MAATNRKDILDPAILRPGSFDRDVSRQTGCTGKRRNFESTCKSKPLGEGRSEADRTDDGRIFRSRS